MTGSREFTCRCCGVAVDVCGCGWRFSALVEMLRHDLCHGDKWRQITSGRDDRYDSFADWVASGIAKAIADADEGALSDEDTFGHAVLFAQFGVIPTPETGLFNDPADPDVLLSEYISVDRVAEVVAKNYLRRLVTEQGLKPHQLCEIDRRNETIHPTCDAAHDFCDANMPMAAAMENVVGKTPIDEPDGSPEHEVLSSIWGEAFGIAKLKLTYRWAIAECYLTFHPMRNEIDIVGDFDAMDDHLGIETKADGGCLYDTLDDALHGHSWRLVWEVSEVSGVLYAHVPGLFSKDKTVGYLRVREGDIEELAGHDTYIFNT